jgi:hypothetical protein
VTSGPTGLPPAAATAARPEALWRGHGTIEDRVHDVRDATLGEDACRVRVGNAPQAPAARRNGVLDLRRALGRATVADALRHDGAFAHRALALLSLRPARL